MVGDKSRYHRDCCCATIQKSPHILPCKCVMIWKKPFQIGRRVEKRRWRFTPFEWPPWSPEFSTPDNVLFRNSLRKKKSEQVISHNGKATRRFRKYIHVRYLTPDCLRETRASTLPRIHLCHNNDGLHTMFWNLKQSGKSIVIYYNNNYRTRNKRGYTHFLATRIYLSRI